MPQMQPIYDPEFVKPLREELVTVGCEELVTPEDVDAALGQTEGTALLVVNSICGCAAGSARPGVMLALQHDVIPDKLVTVFAGQDREATEKAREYIVGYPPSSPCIVVFKDGKVAGIIERQQIEGRSPVEIAEALKGAFSEFCSRPGPSIPKEEFEKIVPQQSCGSQTPLFPGSVAPENLG